MQQLQLSNYEVAVSLGCSMAARKGFNKGSYAANRSGHCRAGIVLGVSQENLTRGVQRKIEGLAATV
jgi:hypothetical protein